MSGMHRIIKENDLNFLNLVSKFKVYGHAAIFKARLFSLSVSIIDLYKRPICSKFILKKHAKVRKKNYSIL